MSARGSGQGRVEACVAWVSQRIEGQVFRPGDRLPSLRALAKAQGVSPFTAVEAYDRLVAMGLIESRPGSGFYVRAAPRASRPMAEPSRIDLDWLMRHMLDSGRARGPGLGVLPRAWLDGAQLGAAVRGLGREGPDRWLASGVAHGFAPLREVLQQRLAGLGVIAGPDQIVLTTGITHGLDLVLRRLVNPGDSVLVLDPSWFGALGLLTAHGARIVAVPTNAEGPDLEALERVALETRPRLMILSATAQNPTSLTFGPGVAAAILELATRHDFAIFEDDVYADLGEPGAVRLAALDQLDRVIYAGSFSKTLAANVRVGFVAARGDHAQALADAKLLSGFTTPELNERLVHKLLVEGRHARHVAGLRDRLAERRAAAFDLLDGLGFEIFGRPRSGMFLWVDMGCDTHELAVAARARGQLIAPGGLFSPDQAASSWMRFNIATPHDDALADLLAAAKAARDRR